MKKGLAGKIEDVIAESIIYFVGLDQTSDRQNGVALPEHTTLKIIDYVSI